MFDDTISELKKLFDEDAKPSFLEEEIEVVPEKYSAVFR